MLILAIFAALSVTPPAKAPSSPGPDLEMRAPAMSPEAEAYLDRALDILQQQHMNRDKVDWPAVRAKAHDIAAGALAPKDTYRAIWSAISALGERHTLLIPARPPGSPNIPPRQAPTGRISDGIAVLALPSLLMHPGDPGDTGAPYKKTLRDLIVSADAAGACGWIIDLRGHSGGNMWPGVLGLSPLLGAGPLGAFVKDGRPTPWPVDPRPGQTVGRPDAPIAVLIGPRTASAGEDIAVAFAGRPNTRFFGQPTAGFTSINTSVLLSDNAVLAVTTGYVADRAGRTYQGPIRPDAVTALDDAENEARAWLNGHGCGGAI
jgi:carboxyl-terminal processing protease